MVLSREKCQGGSEAPRLIQVATVSGLLTVGSSYDVGSMGNRQGPRGAAVRGEADSQQTPDRDFTLFFECWKLLANDSYKVPMEFFPSLRPDVCLFEVFKIPILLPGLEGLYVIADHL